MKPAILQLEIPNPASCEKAARSLLSSFPDHRLFAFYGEMGAGKTTFIKALCRFLEVIDLTSSPSFGLIHEYQTEQGDVVFHCDFYRIESNEEAYDLGFEELVYSGQFCFIEWPERITSMLPEEAVHVKLAAMEDGKRWLSARVEKKEGVIFK